MKKRAGWALRSGTYYARFRLGKAGRKFFKMPTCTNDDEATARATKIGAIVGVLELHGMLDVAENFATKAANAKNEKELSAVEKAVAALASGEKTLRGTSVGYTFAEHAKDLVDGKLATQNIDHVRARKSKTQSVDASRIRDYINPIIGKMPLKDIRLEHCDEVMRRLPAHLSSATRRQVAQIVSRLMKLAAYPCKHIERSPLPQGWMPRIRPGKGHTFLYPDEDAKLMACKEVPLHWRVFYGVLIREGLRASEAMRATWDSADLKRGVFRLDENKTGDARMWAMDHGTRKALEKWKAHAARPRGNDLLFPGIVNHHLAVGFRAHLKRAEVERVELHEDSAVRSKIRAHDLRASFVTMAFATGKSEAWIQDRTGHTTSLMLNRYRRQARTAAELELGWFMPLDEAIPEFREGGNQSVIDSNEVDSHVEDTSSSVDNRDNEIPYSGLKIRGRKA